jgi:hypothetical protein
LCRQSAALLAAVFGLFLKLRLERRKLGEGRVRIGRLFAPLEAIALAARPVALTVLRMLGVFGGMIAARTAAVTELTALLRRPGRRNRLGLRCLGIRAGLGFGSRRLASRGRRRDCRRVIGPAPMATPLMLPALMLTALLRATLLLPVAALRTRPPPALGSRRSPDLDQEGFGNCLRLQLSRRLGCRFGNRLGSRL